MKGFVEARHVRTGEIKSVPAHFVNNASIFGRIVWVPADTEVEKPAQASTAKKKSRRQQAAEVSAPELVLEEDSPVEGAGEIAEPDQNAPTGADPD